MHLDVKAVNFPACLRGTAEQSQSWPPLEVWEPGSRAGGFRDVHTFGHGARPTVLLCGHWSKADFHRQDPRREAFGDWLLSAIVWLSLIGWAAPDLLIFRSLTHHRSAVLTDGLIFRACAVQ